EPGGDPPPHGAVSVEGDRDPRVERDRPGRHRLVAQGGEERRQRGLAGGQQDMAAVALRHRASRRGGFSRVVAAREWHRVEPARGLQAPAGTARGRPGRGPVRRAAPAVPRQPGPVAGAGRLARPVPAALERPARRSRTPPRHDAGLTQEERTWLEYWNKPTR